MSSTSYQVSLKKTYYGQSNMPTRADAGWVLKLMEKTAILAGRKFSECQVMTVGIDKIVFKNPLFDGEQAHFSANILKKGNSSVQVIVEVSAENFVTCSMRIICLGIFNLVAVDNSLNKVFIPEKKDFKVTMYQELEKKVKSLCLISKSSAFKPDLPIVNQNETLVEESDVILPSELNSMNIVFGGDLLNWMSKLSYNVGQKFLGHSHLIAVALDTIQFKTPVFKGDLICMSAKVDRAYQSSFDVKVDLKIFSNQTCLVKEIHKMGYFTLVALDDRLKPILCPNLKKS